MSTETTETTALTPGCTCGVGETYDGLAHRAVCRAPRAVAEILATSSNTANVAGVLTNSEEELVRAVTYLLRDRLSDKGGSRGNLDFGELGRTMVRLAAIKICGDAS